jgi:hypothetical protein
VSAYHCYWDIVENLSTHLSHELDLAAQADVGDLGTLLYAVDGLGLGRDYGGHELSLALLGHVLAHIPQVFYVLYVYGQLVRRSVWCRAIRMGPPRHCSGAGIDDLRRIRAGELRSERDIERAGDLRAWLDGRRGCAARRWALHLGGRC